MKESRLFKIVYCLLDKKQVTALQLSEMLEVSLRTIYRDIDSLSMAGIPIYTERGRNGGICLMKDFILDKAILSDEEKKKILAALKSLNAVSVENQEILLKLSALFQMNEEDDWLELDFSRWGSSNDNEKFEQVKKAILEHHCLSIEYAGSNSEITTRIIEPMKLVYKSKAWYVKSYCRLKQEHRLFKLNRMIRCDMLDEIFTPIPFIPHPVNVCHDERIRLRFPANMAYRVYDEFDSSQIEKDELGRFTVCAVMPMDRWLISSLLSFEEVEILEPADLKKYVAQCAKAIYERNQE